ncbi:MAG: MASE3 domain-containing protein [Thermodesulfobacteriota bacterium]
MREPPSSWPPGLTVLLGILLFLGLYLTSLDNYLLFHSLAEIFSVIIAGGVFTLAWNSRRFIANNYLLFLGIALLFVAFLDLVHTLAYKGMGVFPGYTANLPTQLWIAARFLQSLSLLAAPWFLKRRLRPGLAFGGFFLVSALLLLSIFHGGIFPDCFVAGRGLTAFKIYSEYLISFILLAAMGFLWQQRQAFDPGVLRLLLCSILLSIGSELAFTFYVSVYGLSNLIGHLFKILAFYCIYKAIIETGLVKPFNLLFRDLKLREEALQKERDTIEALNAELVQRVRQLEATNQELEAFSYFASHDLQAPLRAISGFSRILEEQFHPFLDQEGQRFLKIIQDNSLKMKLLINSLLSLSRMERRDLKRTEVNMAEMVRSVFEEQKSGAANAPQLLIKTLPPAQGDAVMLRQVWVNLLANALKFTQSQEQPVIEVEGWREEQENLYCIKDNGIGFDMKHAENIFDSFRRLHGDGEFAGTGIGLALVKRIIERHGGRVWAEGQAGEGAAFYFSLPR